MKSNEERGCPYCGYFTLRPYPPVCPNCDVVVRAELTRLRAELAKRERQIVWVAKHVQRLGYQHEPRRYTFEFGGPPDWMDAVEYDGTPAGLLAAVDEAMGEK